MNTNATSPIQRAQPGFDPLPIVTGEPVVLTCQDCGGPFEHTPEFYGEMRALVPPFCDFCTVVAQDRIADIHRIDANRRRMARATNWPRVALAPVYVETDMAHPDIDAGAMAAALAWRPGARGLAIVGPSRRGKTRCLHLALRAAYEAGRDCHAIREVDFAVKADLAAFGSREEQRQARDGIRRCHSAGILLLDDVGKARANPAVSEALYSLLDFRAMHGRPVLWSGQAGSQWLSDKYGPDHGPAIVNRLGLEFCEVVAIKGGNPDKP